MKTKYGGRILQTGCIVAAAAMIAAGCGESEIEAYASNDMLWITQKQEVYDPFWREVDVANLTRSFSLYPGDETLEVPFVVNLIGNVADYDRPYRLVVVDSLTTAVASEYELPTPSFHAGRVQDTLWVRLVKSPRLDTEQAKLTLILAGNEYFSTGYPGRLTCSVTYDNAYAIPAWWTENIANSYLGPYSAERFKAFYQYSGLNDITGLSPSELRLLALGFRDYIEANHLTEADGSPMTLPVI